MRSFSLLAPLILAGAAICCATSPDRVSPTDAEVSWVCEVRNLGQTGFATGTISLQVGQQKILITDHPRHECYIIPKSEYKPFGIPPSAIAALHHGFGPVGDTLWVLRRGGALVVYDRLDWDEHPSKTTIIKHIRLPRQTSNQPIQPTASPSTASPSDD